MSNPTTPRLTVDQFVTQMTDRMAQIARTLSAWAQSEPHTLQDLETHGVRLLHDLGTALLSGLCTLAAQHPAPDIACPCGAQARVLRLRPATVTTVLGQITYHRAYYQCPSCRHTQTPLDTQLQVCAGSFSAGVQELLALLGATQDSFAQAAQVFERLCLVQVCPNSVRAATEDLGQTLIAHDQQVIAAAQEAPPDPATTSAPDRLYISMDGVVAHMRDGGWKELKTGCVSTTRTRVSRRRSDQVDICTVLPSYVVALQDADTFGWHMWAEAARRQVDVASEVVVLGDGAHWIWNLAALHFPDATQIVDWYHASQYLWSAATVIAGPDSAQRTAWAREQETALWDGNVAAVLAALQPHAGRGDAVDEAISYYTNHQHRMDYSTYRARGLQIGSGTIESACKQLVSARLKLAGMIWNTAGAEAVAVVRAWLRSERWDEAMRLRPPPRRTYRRREADAQVEAAVP
jgi:hypothetical protein